MGGRGLTHIRLGDVAQDPWVVTWSLRPCVFLGRLSLGSDFIEQHSPCSHLCLRVTLCSALWLAQGILLNFRQKKRYRNLEVMEKNLKSNKTMLRRNHF